VPRKAAVHLDWLCGDEVRLPDGRVMSWVGDGAYPYDEALCYLLRLLSWCASFTRDDRYLDRAEPLLGRLQALAGKDGGIGRDGAIYLFDTGMALAALAGVARASRRDLTAWMNPLADTMLALIRKESAVVGEAPDDRWSTRFGPHLAKLVIGLTEASGILRRPELRTTGQKLVQRFLLESSRDGLFYSEPGFGTSYLHAHCYAAEGLVYAVEEGLVADDGLLMKSGDTLSKALLENGAVDAWWGTGDIAEANDTTAQAVRIWQVIDPKGFAFEIKRALAYLETQTNKKGGVLYRPDSDHLNAWTTVFAVQAMLYAKRGPDWQWLI
jgi:hypothetical protein